LNLVEAHFAVLKRTALNNTHYPTAHDTGQGLLAGVRYLKARPTSHTWPRI